jgi:hypothetical protein
LFGVIIYILYIYITIKTNKDMKATFELKTYMTANRDFVINTYNDMTKERFFNGISLASFMTQVYNIMLENNPRSEKRADSLLKTITYSVVDKNVRIGGNDVVQGRLKAKYAGTQMMALVN